MDLQEFMKKHGSNIQSDESWIFPKNLENYKTTVFQLVGVAEVEREGRENIPYFKLLDTANKVQMNLSLWSTDKQVGDLQIGNTLQLKMNGNKVHLDKV